MKSVFIFAPNTLNKNDIGFLEGFTREINDNLVFYITNDKLILTSDNTVGYCSSQTPYNIFTREDSEWIHINNTTHEIQINNLDNYEYEAGYTIILYDINAFAECDITTFRLQEHGEHFDELCSTLHKINYNTVKPRFMIAYIILMFLIETILEVC